MDQELISKKELLELTGISYGQLYRWKRKNLIPEEWFIRKSTFTGQETFFHKQQILERIERIKNLKDDLSLDELAGILSSNESDEDPWTRLDLSLTREQLMERNIVSQVALTLYTEECGEPGVFTFPHLLCVYVLDKWLKTGEISMDEGKMLVRTFSDHYTKVEGKNCELFLIRKMGVSMFLFAPSPCDLYFDHLAKIVCRLPIAACVEELKAIGK